MPLGGRAHAVAARHLSLPMELGEAARGSKPANDSKLANDTKLFVPAAPVALAAATSSAEIGAG